MNTLQRFALAALIALALSLEARAGNIAPYLNNQLLDNNGDPLSGAQACSFLAGTSTVSQLFSDKARNTAHGDCVTADSAGRFPGAYCDPENVLKIQFKNASGTEIDVYDDVICPFGADDVTEARDALDLGSIVTESIGTSGDAVPKLNAANTWSSLQTFNASAEFNSTSAGAAAAPTVRLSRDSASPAVDDILGEIVFDGKDDGGGDVEYASLQGGILDETDGTEDGELCASVSVAGSKTEIACFDADGLDLKTGSLRRAGSEQVEIAELTATDFNDSAALTFAHGLSCTIDRVYTWLIATDTDCGYSSGDKVPMSVDLGENGDNCTSSWDGTNVTFSCAANLEIMNKGGAATVCVADETKWDVDGVAYCENY